MAIYHFAVRVITRSKGRNAVAAAAYRSASIIYDEQLGLRHNYTKQAGLLHAEVLLPDAAPLRLVDRATLWNEVERLEKRKDAALAREVEFALPAEISEAEAIRLSRDFLHQEVVAIGMVADLTVHCRKSKGGGQNTYALAMLTMRSIVQPDDLPIIKYLGSPLAPPCFGMKVRAWNDRGLLQQWRKAWADFANARLAELGCDSRIDHRSNTERGIELEPQNKIGAAASRRAASGEGSERVDEHAEIARRKSERIGAGNDQNSTLFE